MIKTRKDGLENLKYDKKKKNNMRKEEIQGQVLNHYFMS